MSDRDQKLENLFRDVMPSETLEPRKRTRTKCLNWDSLTQFKLVLAIEQEFGVTLSDEEAIDLNSFDTAMQILNDKAAGKAN
jgi:acyl carrier protein